MSRRPNHFSLTPRRLLAVGAATLSLAGASVLPSAAGAATLNACHATGLTAKVVKTVFPKLAALGAGQTEEATTPPNLGICELTPGGKTYMASIIVELWSASDFATLSPEFINDGKKQGLRNLGPGAYYSPEEDSPKNNGQLLFKHGAYSVLIYANLDGGAAVNYPTINQYLALAHAIYKHL